MKPTVSGRAGKRLMWAVYFGGKLRLIVTTRLQAGAHAWPENDIRRVKVRMVEVRSKRKASR